MSWNPSLYLKFGSARVRPAVDLLNKAVDHVDDVNAVHNVLDLGCGTGNIADLLCRTFPNAHVEGIDSNPDMIIHALRDNNASELKERMSFRVSTTESESVAVREKYDVVYSNASLHWSLHHEVLLPNIIHNLVKHDGVLAIQMPDTRWQASHLLMIRAAENCGVYDKVKDVRIPRVEETPEWYYNLLRPLVKEIDIWSTEYIQQLATEQIPPSPHTVYSLHNAETIYEIPSTPKTPSDQVVLDPVDCMHTDNTVDTSLRHPVYEYTRSTGLMPFVAALGGEDSIYGVQFINEYNRLLYEAYPIVRVDNKITSFEEYVTLMPFKRMFIVCKV